MPEAVWLGGISFLAGVIHGLTGFGVILVALPLMVLLMDIKVAIPLILLCALVINILLVAQIRKHVDPGRWLPFLLAALPGIPIGAWCLKVVDPHWLELLAGGVVLATVVAAGPRKTKPAARELHPAWVRLAGFLSGFLGGSIGAAGPPVIICTALQPWDRHRIKATLVAYFTVVSLVIVVSHLFLGLVTATVLHHFGICVLPLLCGVLAGIALFKRMGDDGYRLAVKLLILVLGGMMLTRGAAGL